VERRGSTRSVSVCLKSQPRHHSLNDRLQTAVFFLSFFSFFWFVFYVYFMYVFSIKEINRINPELSKQASSRQPLFM